MNTQLQSLFQWVGSSDANAGKDWGQKQKGPTEDEMVGWHRWHNRHEFGQIPRDSEGQGSLACCSPWGCKELDATEWPNNKCTCTTGAFSPVDFRGGGVATGGQTSQEVTTTKLWHLNSEAHLPTKKKILPYNSVMTFLVARVSQPATVESAALTVTNRISLQGWEPPPPSPGRRRELGSSEGANAQRPETFFFFFSFIFISWRLITLQYCSGFCHTSTWIRPETFIFPHDGFSVVLQDKEPQTGLHSTFLAA